jgi:flagellar motor switch protein FliG
MKNAAMVLRALRDPDAKDAVSGWQRVAVLLVSLGQELAAQLMRDLDTDEVEQIAEAIAAIKTVPREVQEQVVAEFEEQLSSGRLAISGGEQVARGLLESALGADKAQEVLARLGRGKKTDGFGMLDNADPAQVTPFLMQQHPQTAALILSQITAERAAGFLNHLPAAVQADIAHRIATLDAVSPEVLSALDETLLEELPNILSGRHAVNGPKVAAEILNRVGPGLEKSVLERLDAQDPEMAEQIRNEMFVFDDLARLNPKEVDIVIQHVDYRDLVVAMKSPGKGTVTTILSAMSERRRQLLLDDLNALPPMRLTEVEEAQLRILQQVRHLEEQQLIKLAHGNEDDTYV